MKQSRCLAFLLFFHAAACGALAIEQPISGRPDDASSGATSSAESDARSSRLESDAAFDAFSTQAASDSISPSTPGSNATFAFVINGVVQVPLGCPSARWEFPSPAYDGGQCGLSCLVSCGPPPQPCPGVTSVLVMNTGEVQIAYIARPTWGLGAINYVPGVPTGDANELTGLLDPGAQVDITSVYESGVVAVLGSSRPFSPLDARYAGDEGTIPWPAAVSGSNGSAQMWIAEIEEVGGCTAPAHAW